MDVNLSPVDMHRTSARRLPDNTSPHAKRFEAFNFFPSVNSKYSTKALNQVPLFDNFSSRNADAFVDMKKIQEGRSILAPDKELKWIKLDKGNVKFKK